MKHTLHDGNAWTTSYVQPGDVRLGGLSQLSKVGTLVAQDQKYIFTLTCYILILITYLNLKSLQSSVLGLATSVSYFLINGIFLGRAFFEKEDAFFKLMFGILLLIMLLGFVGWLAVILYKLDTTIFILVLFIVTTFSSLLSKRVKYKDVN